MQTRGEVTQAQSLLRGQEPDVFADPLPLRAFIHPDSPNSQTHNFDRSFLI